MTATQAMDALAPDATAMIDEAAEAVRVRLGGRTPTAAIVLGSGLGQFAERLADAVLRKLG